MMVSISMPIGVAYGLAHPETFSRLTLTERERLVRFTRTMFEREYAFLEKALVKGAGPVFFTVGTEFVAPPLCAPSAFDALIAPFDAPIFDLIHRYGGKVLVHHHGKIAALLEHIADLGADGIQPIEEPPIGDCTMAEAKRRIGDRVCLVGSVQYDDFERLTPDEMEALVQRQIGDAARGGAMILAPTAGPYAAVLSERQQENIVRFIDAGHRWGQYPL
jgi:uroporphyrinogen-III decarboxylase